MAFRLSDDDLRAAKAAAAIREANQAQQDYNSRMASASQAIANAGGKKTGLLSSVLSGIGNSIQNTGKGLFDFFGSGVASIGDLGEGIATGKLGTREKDFKKWLYNTDSEKDARLKSGGTALDAASTISDLIPGLGTAGKVALNVGQGIASGAAQNYIDNGENANLEDSLRGALVGGLASGAGQAVGGALGKTASKAGQKASQGALSKALTSQVGRGATTGLVSGAVGAGANTALAGGDLGQTLGSALQGAGQGAVGGGVMAGAMGVAGKVGQKLNNKVLGIDNQPTTTTAIIGDTETMPEATKARRTAVGWDDQPISAEKRNALQKLGKNLEKAGNDTKNADVMGKLNNNTALKVNKNDTLNVLKKQYGYSVDDYDKAANLSEATNKWIKNELVKSGASGVDSTIIKNAQLSPDLVSITDKQAKAYDNKVRSLLSSAEVEGGKPFEYSASGLYDAAEKAGKLANTYYEKSHNKMDGSISNPEVADLAEALNNFKKVARNAADNMVGGEIDDITRGNLVAMLKDAGAPKQSIEQLSKAKSFKELKAMTAPLEEARNIHSQMEITPTKRGATTDNSMSVPNKVLKKAGAAQLLDTVAAPVGSLVGTIEKGLGKAIGGVGDALAGQIPNGKITGAIGSAVSAVNNPALANKAFGGADLGLPTVGDIVTRQTARQAGLSASRNADAERELENAKQEALNAQTDYDNAMAQAQQNYALADKLAQAQSQGQQQLDRISNAMQLALNAGDITSYAKLADLYQEAYKMYGAQEATTTNEVAKLSDNQTKALNALGQLDTLEQMTPDAGTALANSPLGFLVDATGGNDYANQAQSLALTLGYLQSGANVSAKEAENIGKSYIPTAFDSEAVRRNKLQRARELLNTYLYGTQYYQG